MLDYQSVVSLYFASLRLRNAFGQSLGHLDLRTSQTFNQRVIPCPFHSWTCWSPLVVSSTLIFQLDRCPLGCLMSHNLTPPKKKNIQNPAPPKCDKILANFHWWSVKFCLGAPQDMTCSVCQLGWMCIEFFVHVQLPRNTCTWNTLETLHVCWNKRQQHKKLRGVHSRCWHTNVYIN